ncbi:hypothetical protein B0H16DRAFT_1776374 [Mycena metata]|uniref:Uncharacterized protein n=1 Tax=Mycena metata TaxID=1033252 RepID=A0AAD7MR48_9AGAR|nr:hypothetical protein B0H16DRAFT_1776374 [Mycena metata]
MSSLKRPPAHELRLRTVRTAHSAIAESIVADARQTRRRRTFFRRRRRGRGDWRGGRRGRRGGGGMFNLAVCLLQLQLLFDMDAPYLQRTLQGQVNHSKSTSFGSFGVLCRKNPICLISAGRLIRAGQAQLRNSSGSIRTDQARSDPPPRDSLLYQLTFLPSILHPIHVIFCTERISEWPQELSWQVLEAEPGGSSKLPNSAYVLPL